ncbi:MAG: NUDIX hydrolase [Thermoplasmata archaeon]
MSGRRMGEKGRGKRSGVRPEGIRVGVGAVVLDDAGRVLLVKHHPSDDPRKRFWRGRWICPGGMLEFGETLEEGARREVREETGLDIDIVRALEPSDRLIRWWGRKFMQVVYIDFLARVSGRVAADETGCNSGIGKGGRGEGWGAGARAGAGPKDRPQARASRGELQGADDDGGAAGPARGGDFLPRPGSDVAVARWFTVEEIRALGDELHGDTRELLERAGVLPSRRRRARGGGG